MIPILTTLAGLVFRGPNAKAWTTTPVAAILGMLLGPEVIGQFQSGLVEGGLGPAANLIGATLGGLILAAVQWGITWVAENRARTKTPAA